MFISNWIANHFGQAFPWGTMIVNVSGCLTIGFFSGITGPDGVVMTSPVLRQVVAIGVLGGFTTYSSFSLQTINLLAEGELLYGLGNIFLTLLLCLAGTWIGLALAGAMSHRPQGRKPNVRKTRCARPFEKNLGRPLLHCRGSQGHA